MHTACWISCSYRTIEPAHSILTSCPHGRPEPCTQHVEFPVLAKTQVMHSMLNTVLNISENSNAGMEKAQALMPHTAMHMPSKTTVVTCIVVLHVVALSYLLYALYTAQRCVLCLHWLSPFLVVVADLREKLARCMLEVSGRCPEPFFAAQASSAEGAEGQRGSEESQLRV